jgi:hypothetical protein
VRLFFARQHVCAVTFNIALPRAKRKACRKAVSPNSHRRESALTPISHVKPVIDVGVPWFPSPMDGYNEEADGFSPRHEASTIELFFDLWFVGT